MVNKVSRLLEIMSAARTMMGNLSIDLRWGQDIGSLLGHRLKGCRLPTAKLEKMRGVKG